MEHWEFIRQVDPYRLKFRDEKLLKTGGLFNRKGCADPLSGEREPIYVDSDFRNTYNIIGICGIARDTMPFVYKMHDGINNSALFSDFILESVACGFYGTGIYLYWTMPLSTITKICQSCRGTCGVIMEFSFISSQLGLPS